MNSRKRQWKLGAVVPLVTLLFVFGFTTLSVAEYPTKPITLIVNYIPGGGTDLPARVLSGVINKFLGQPMVVMNKPGGGTHIGSDFVAKSKPDGYTLLISYGGLEQTFSPHIRKLPFDPINDFIPITPISIYDGVALVRADAPWRSLNEVVKDAKKNPGKIRFGRSGTFGTNHILSLLFRKEAGIEMRINVPYKGGAHTMTELLGGHVDVAFLGHPISVEHVQAGKVRMLASSGKDRNPYTPEVPTFLEQGFNVVLGNIKGIAAPKGTPADIIAKLNDSIIKASKVKAFKAMMDGFYQPVVTMPQAEYAAFVKKEFDRWANFVKEEGLSADKK